MANGQSLSDHLLPTLYRRLRPLGPFAAQIPQPGFPHAAILVIADWEQRDSSAQTEAHNRQVQAVGDEVLVLGGERDVLLGRVAPGSGVKLLGVPLGRERGVTVQP